MTAGSKTKAKKTPGTRDLMAMNSKQLARATQQFDRELIETRSLTPEEGRQWQKAKRKPGRPRVGRGAAIISVSVEKGLLTKATKLARKLKTSRAQLISRGLRKVLAEHAGE